MAAAKSGANRAMKIYEVECRAVIRVTAENMQNAALYGAAVIRDNTHLISVRAVHQKNLEPAWEDPRRSERPHISEG